MNTVHSFHPWGRLAERRWGSTESWTLWSWSSWVSHGCWCRDLYVGPLTRGSSITPPEPPPLVPRSPTPPLVYLQPPPPIGWRPTRTLEGCNPASGWLSFDAHNPPWWWFWSGCLWGNNPKSELRGSEAPHDHTHNRMGRRCVETTSYSKPILVVYQWKSIDWGSWCCHRTVTWTYLWSITG